MTASSLGSGIDRLLVFSREPFAEVLLRRRMIGTSSESGIDRLNVSEAVDTPYSDEGFDGLRASENSQEAKSSETSPPNSPRSRESGLVVRLFPTPPHVFGVSQNQQLERPNARQGITSETLEGSNLQAMEAEVLTLSRILKSLQPLETFPGSPEWSQGRHSIQYEDIEEAVQGVGVDIIALEAEMLNLSKVLQSLQPLETFPGSSESSLGRDSSENQDTEETIQGVGVDRIAFEAEILNLSKVVKSLQPLETFPGAPESGQVRHSSEYQVTEEAIQGAGVDGIALAAEILNLSRMLKSLQPLETFADPPISGSPPVSPKSSRGWHSSQDSATEATEPEIGVDGILRLSRMFSSVQPLDNLPRFPTTASSEELASSQSSYGQHSSQDRDTVETQQGVGVEGMALEGEVLDLSRQLESSQPLETFPGFPTLASTVVVSPDSSQERDTKETQQGVGVDGMALQGEVLDLSRQLESSQPLETFPGFPTLASTVVVSPDSSQERDTKETQQGVGVEGMALEGEVLDLSRQLESSQPLETFPGFPTLASTVVVSPDSSQERDTKETQQGVGVEGMALEGEVLDLSRQLESSQPLETFPGFPTLASTVVVSPDSSQERDTKETQQGVGVEGMALEGEVLDLSRQLESSQQLETFPGFPTLASTVVVSPDSSQERDTKETQQGVGVDGNELEEVSDLSRQLTSVQPLEKVPGFPNSASTVARVTPVSCEERDTEETHKRLEVDRNSLDISALPIEPVSPNSSQERDTEETLQGAVVFPFPNSASTLDRVSPVSCEERVTEATHKGVEVDTDSLEISALLSSPESSQDRTTEESHKGVRLDVNSLDNPALAVEPVSPESNDETDREETFPGFPTSALSDEPDPSESSQRGDSSKDRDVDEVFPGFMKTFPGFRISSLAVEDVSQTPSQGGGSSQGRDTEETQLGVGVDGRGAAEAKAGLRPDTALHQSAVKDRNGSLGSGGVVKSNLPAPKGAKSRGRKFSDSSRGSTSSSSMGSALQLQVPTADLGVPHPRERFGAPHPGFPLRRHPSKNSEENRIISKSQEQPVKMGVERDPSFPYYSADKTSGKTLFADFMKKPQPTANELVEIVPKASDMIRRLKAAYLDVEEDELLSTLVPPGILALDVNSEDYSIALEYYGPPIHKPKMESNVESSFRDLPRNSSNVTLAESKPKRTSQSSWPQSSVISDVNPFGAGIQRFRDRNKRELPAMSASLEEADNPASSCVPIIRNRSRTGSRDQRLNCDTVRSVLEPAPVEVSVLKSLATNSHSHRPGKLKWWSK